eukprot:m.215158 g.215158  ORF g.215158 m.215158 type:complete len:648 (+) comp39744_c0_seq1:892-2835(+)
MANGPEDLRQRLAVNAAAIEDVAAKVAEVGERIDAAGRKIAAAADDDVERQRWMWNEKGLRNERVALMQTRAALLGERTALVQLELELVRQELLPDIAWSAWTPCEPINLETNKPAILHEPFFPALDPIDAKKEPVVSWYMHSNAKKYLDVCIRFMKRPVPNYVGGSNILLAEGPPGTGKTLATCALARHVASTSKKPVVYIRLTIYTLKIVQLRTGESGTLEYRSGELSPTRAGSQLVCPEGTLLTIVDGYRTHVYGERIIHWADMQLYHAPYELRLYSEWYRHALDNGQDWESFTMASWDQSDYEAALRLDDKLLQRVRKLESDDAAGAAGVADAAHAPPAEIKDESLRDLIDHRFFYAGHNARRFFNYSQEWVKKEVARDVDILRSPFSSGAAVFTSRSHLVLCDNLVVSEYALIQLVAQWTEEVDKYVARAKSSAQNSCRHQEDIKSVLDWVFKYRVLLQVKSQMTLRLDSVRTFKADECVFFGPLNEMVVPDGKASVWFVPTQWNQGAYDFVHVALPPSLPNDDDNTAAKRSKHWQTAATAVFTFFRISAATEQAIKCRSLTQAIAQLCGKPAGTPLEDIVSRLGRIPQNSPVSICREVRRLRVEIVGVRRQEPAAVLKLEDEEKEGFFQTSSIVLWRIGGA